MSKSETILWQSRRFLRLALTAEHLSVLKDTYRLIKHFEPEMRRAEAWVFANQHRMPKKNWKNFINNWMRIAEEKIRERQDAAAARGQFQIHSDRRWSGDAVPLGQILQTSKKKGEQS